MAAAAHSIGFEYSAAQFDSFARLLNARAPVLDDECIDFFLRLFFKMKNLGETDVGYVASLLLQVLRSPNAGAAAAVSVVYRKEIERRGRDDNPLPVVMPLHDKFHWSLLVRLPTGKWVHYDSLAPMHRDVASGALSLLGANGGIDAMDCMRAVGDIGLAHWQPPRQEDGWECGFYVLMYAHALIMTDFQHPLDQLDASRYSPERLPNFRRCLLDWLAIARRYLQPQ